MKVSNFSNIFRKIRRNLDLKFLQKNVAKNLIIGGGIAAFGGISSKILTFVSIVYVSRHIGAENFGIYIYFQAALMFFCLLFSIGLPIPATKITSEIFDKDKNKLKQIITLFYSATFLIGVVGTLLFILVGIYLFPENMTQSLFNINFVLITSLAILCINLDALNHAFLFGLAEIKNSILALVLASVLGLLSVITLVGLFGMYGAMFSIASVPAIQLLFSSYMCHKKLKANNLLGGIINLSYSRIFFDEGLPTMLMGILLALAIWMVQTIMVVTGSGLAEVGVFGVGQQAFQIVVFVPFAFGRIILPLLARNIYMNTSGESGVLIKMNFILNFMMTLPVCLLIVFFAGEFLSIFGNYDTSYINVIRIMAIAAFVSSIVSPIGTVIIARGKYWLGFIINLVWASIYILGSFTMSSLGALGISYALLIAYMLHSISVIIWFWFDIKKSSVNY